MKSVAEKGSIIFYQEKECADKCFKELMLAFTDENNYLLRKPVSEMYRFLSQSPV